MELAMGSKENNVIDLLKRIILDLTPPKSPNNMCLFNKLDKDIFVTSRSDSSQLSDCTNVTGNVELPMSNDLIPGKDADPSAHCETVPLQMKRKLKKSPSNISSRKRIRVVSSSSKSSTDFVKKQNADPSAHCETMPLQMKRKRKKSPSSISSKKRIRKRVTSSSSKSSTDFVRKKRHSRKCLRRYSSSENEKNFPRCKRHSSRKDINEHLQKSLRKYSNSSSESGRSCDYRYRRKKLYRNDITGHSRKSPRRYSSPETERSYSSKYSRRNSSRRDTTGPSRKSPRRYSSPETERSYSSKYSRRNSSRRDADAHSYRSSRKSRKRSYSSWSDGSSDSEYSSRRSDRKDVTDFELNVMRVKQETSEINYSERNVFKCDVCHISLNSQNILAAHIQGKRHLKTLKLKKESSAAQLLLADTATIASDGRSSETKLNLVPLHEPSQIEEELNKISDVPLMDLQEVHEIREGFETLYECSLCRISCNAGSIIYHLQGFSHLKMCFRKHLPHVEQRSNWSSRRDMKKDLELLMKEEQKLGRGSIQVFQKIPTSSSSEAGPSTRYEYNRKARSIISDSSVFLDTSKSYIRCKLCDSHMNNLQMWEAHVIGRRHRSNLRKSPAEIKSESKYTKIDELSKLEEKLAKSPPDFPVVGLSFIRETQLGADVGLRYNCFLCGACCTALDIEDHLALSKHMEKYLERNNESILNQVHSLDVNMIAKDDLVFDLCVQEFEKFGSGTVEVYVPS